MDAIKFVPKELIETTCTLGGFRIHVLLQVIFPYVLPSIIDACRVNIAASWNLVIVADLVAATEGLGHMITVAQRFLKTDEIFVDVIVIRPNWSYYRFVISLGFANFLPLGSEVALLDLGVFIGSCN